MTDIKKSTRQKELTATLNSMDIGDSITLSGYDYMTVQKQAWAGKEWATDLLDGADFPGTYIRTGADTWEEATFECYPAILTKKEMMKLIKTATEPITNLKKLRKYRKEVFG